jgi:two-component system response regulator HydG
VLDRRRVRPVGGLEERELDVRCLFATSRNLRALLDEGRFRQDLYYRLSAVELHVPPLRERIEDIPLLVERFLAELSFPPRSVTLTAQVLAALQAHSWPGNLRELKNAIVRLVLSGDGTTSASAVKRLLGDAAPQDALGQVFDPVFAHALLRGRPLPALQVELERQYLLRLHREKCGDVRAMAAALGLTRRAVYKRFRRLGLAARPQREENRSPGD